MQTNARLAVVVAAVGVAAVAIGGVLAYQQVPEVLGAAAAPLAASPTSTPTPSNSPSRTPSAPPATPLPTPAKPSGTPVTTPPHPGKVQLKVEVDKLTKGRDPQLPYLVGREVLGGGGWSTKVPGSQSIQQVERIGNSVLVIVAKRPGKPGSELLKLDSSGEPERTDNVTSLLTTEGGTAAYVAERTDADGVPTGGGTIYYRTTEPVPPLKLQVPAAGGNGLKVVGLTDKVYYRAQDGLSGPWKLFEWTPGDSTAKQVKTVDSPTRVSSDGAVVSSISSAAGGQTCSAVSLLDSGKRLWKSCEHLITGFSPDHSITIGLAGYGANTPPTKVQVHDTATGKLLREWTGSFGGAVAEDDQHILILAGVEKLGGDWSKSSIIRCEVPTGSCEAAIGLTTSRLSISGR
ncbi:hypothetical protein AB0P21_28820 [Kribbella sp. NPDC056861]|uniref:hypothetical protein n=1 Tax=Kribbella sp. NPDC056861 TaxID=3154857 RepID=UPI003441C6F3